MTVVADLGGITNVPATAAVEGIEGEISTDAPAIGPWRRTNACADAFCNIKFADLRWNAEVPASATIRGVSPRINTFPGTTLVACNIRGTQLPTPAAIEEVGTEINAQAAAIC